MKYKKGDVVFLRSDLILGLYYGTHYVNSVINNNKGKYFKIERCDSRSYLLEGFPATTGVTDEMVIKVRQGGKF